MIKQQQRVIKKGDYYEVETSQETMVMMSKTRKDQPTSSSVAASQSQAQQSECILTVVPTFQSARSMYFSSAPQNLYSDKNVAELKEQLEFMYKEEGINDEDRKEIEKLMEEIDRFRDNKEMPLNQLTQQQASSSIKQTAKIQPSPTTITLTSTYNIKSLTKRIEQLQSLNFPDLINLQHQLQIMLGEKKPLQSLEMPQMNEREKEEFNNLYNHLNSLEILDSTQKVIESIAMNEQKHVQMKAWVQKMETVQGINSDFLTELKQDALLIEKLQKNFDWNVKQVREILKQIKFK